MIRINHLAIASACSLLLPGFAVVGAAPVVLASEAKSKLSSDLTRPQPPASVQPPSSAANSTGAEAPRQADEPRRAVRVVYVGSITAR